MLLCSELNDMSPSRHHITGERLFLPHKLCLVITNKDALFSLLHSKISFCLQKGKNCLTVWVCPAVRCVSSLASHSFSHPAWFISPFVSWFLVIDFLRLTCDVQGCVTVSASVCASTLARMWLPLKGTSVEKFNDRGAASLKIPCI